MWISTNACELVGALVPFKVFVLAMWLENMLDNVLQRISSYQALGCARVDEESMDGFTFHC